MEVTSISARKSSALIVAALLLATLAVFWNVPYAQFVMWDDDINIYRNPNHGGLTWNRIIWMFTDVGYVMYYAPISWLTLSIIHQFFGLNPLGYHLASLLLHLANTALVYSLIRTLLSGVQRQRQVSPAEQRQEQEGEKKVTAPVLSLCAGLGALLWSVHPLRVEPVAWATGISHLLAGFFALVSLLCYLKSQAAQMPRDRWLLLGASLFGFLLGIISYPVVMGFPAILVILDVLVLRRFAKANGGPFSRATSGIWLEKLPFILLSAGVLAFTLYRRAHATEAWYPTVSLAAFSIVQRAAQAFYVWGYYLWKSFVPVSLAPAYSTLEIVNPSEPRFILSFALIAGLTAFLALNWRRFPALLAVWLAYLCLLVPMLGLTEHPHYTSDRYSYLVSVAISLVISAGLLKATARRGIWWISLSLCGAAAIGSAALSYKQIFVWRDSVALCEHLLKTLRDNDWRAKTHWRLATFYRGAGKPGEAQRELHEALQLTPDSAPIHTDLGLVLLGEGDLDQALREFDAALAVDHGFAYAHVAKASVLLAQGKLPSAIEEYERTLQTNPKQLVALNQLAWIRATNEDSTLRNGEQAVVLASRACQLTGFSDPRTLIVLAAAYAETGEFDAAIRTAGNAADLAAARHDPQLSALVQELAANFRQGRAFHKNIPAPGQQP